MPMTSLQDIAKHFPQLSAIEEIKIGGQKCVYSAVHAKHGDIALKIVLNDGDDDRILREIERTHLATAFCRYCIFMVQ